MESAQALSRPGVKTAFVSLLTPRTHALLTHISICQSTAPTILNFALQLTPNSLVKIAIVLENKFYVLIFFLSNFNAAPHHSTPHHTTPPHTKSHHSTPHHNAPHRTTTHRITPHHTTFPGQRVLIYAYCTTFHLSPQQTQNIALIYVCAHTFGGKISRWMRLINS